MHLIVFDAILVTAEQHVPFHAQVWKSKRQEEGDYRQQKEYGEGKTTGGEEDLEKVKKRKEIALHPCILPTVPDTPQR